MSCVACAAVGNALCTRTSNRQPAQYQCRHNNPIVLAHYNRANKKSTQVPLMRCAYTLSALHMHVGGSSSGVMRTHTHTQDTYTEWREKNPHVCASARHVRPSVRPFVRSRADHACLCSTLDVGVVHLMWWPRHHMLRARGGGER